MILSEKHAALIFGVMMSAIMSLFMSFAMTAINVGLHPHFLRLWFQAFATGFIIATPVSFGAVPIATRAVNWLTNGHSSGMGAAMMLNKEDRQDETDDILSRRQHQLARVTRALATGHEVTAGQESRLI